MLGLTLSRGTSPERTSAPTTATAAGRRSVPGLMAWALAAALVAGAACYDGARRVPTGPADGATVNGAPAHAPTTGHGFRVATWNIDGGCGVDGKRDLARCSASLGEFDLIGLNEVHGRSLADRRNQAQILGEDLRLGWLFAPTERRWWRDDFGNAVLTSLPVSHWQRFPISTPGLDANRNVVLIRVRVGSQVVNVLNTHVSRHAGAAAELRSVAELFLSLGEPAVLLGDLNATDDAPQVRRLLDTPGVVNVIDRVPGGGVKHVEWILARGLRCTDAGVKKTGASDHYLYWAELETQP